MDNSTMNKTKLPEVPEPAHIPQPQDELAVEYDRAGTELEGELELGSPERGETPAMAELEAKQAQVEPAPKGDPVKRMMEFVKSALIVILLSIVLTQFVIQRNTVIGTSMVPTLENGDELFIEKVSRYFAAIYRGDIITVDTAGLDTVDPNRVIKRVVGMPGETVEIKDGHVYINEQLLSEPYLAATVPTTVHDPSYTKITLQAGEYFCLGDNREHSKDSRNFGPVPEANILGKVLLRFLPFAKFGLPK